MNRAAALVAVLVLTWGVAARLAAASGPAVFQSAPGRFEIAAMGAADAERVAAQAEEAWRFLAAPLELPDRFGTPVFVRLVPAAESSDAAPFRVIVEPGGVVSVRVRWSAETPGSILRRALVQSLLMRLAVAHYGVTAKLAVPLWLEVGAVGWWQTRAEPAQLDAVKRESGSFAPPALAEILGWQRGADEPRRLAVGAIGLLAWLNAESARGAEWHGLLRRLLAGEEGGAALAATFPGRFADENDRELWWQVGWHQLRRARVLPTQEADESREDLGALARFVFAVDGHDAVTPLRTVLAHAGEPPIAAELRQRAAELSRLLPALHPFYRNAGLTLAEAFGSPAAAGGASRTLAARFDQDWNDARELEAASRAALDALENR